MNDGVAIICSRADPASLNIFEQLTALEAWQDRDGFLVSGGMSLHIHDSRQSTLEGLDDRLADLGLHPGMVVFASRHEARSGLPWFGGHFTGIIDGGRRELCAAAPGGLRSFLHNIREMAPPGFTISAEATHHGPVDMKTPSFFAEIGSTQDQWRDANAGEAVARAILALRCRALPVFLGFGGGHYVQRQTELMFESDIAFGHLFSSYKMADLDAALVEDARTKSGADYAYVDRKSLRSEERKRILAILDEMGLPVLRSREIRAKFPPRDARR